MTAINYDLEDWPVENGTTNNITLRTGQLKI